MYEGVNVQNGGITVDLSSLQKTANGELILEGVSSLKIFVENGASYDQTKLEILENNDDVRVSFTDANGNEIFIILKGLAAMLLSNQTDNPVFEVFEGPVQLATMTTIDDLQAAAAGGEPAGSAQTANPTSTGDLDGTTSDDTADRLSGLSGAGTFNPTAPIIGNFAPVAFDVTLKDIEVLGEEGAGDKNIITGALSVSDADEEDIGLHTFTSIEGTLVVTSYNEDGTINDVITVDDNILVVLNPDGTFEISGDFNDLGLGEYATVSFDYFATDIEGATSNVSTVTLTIEGTNDIPVVTDVNLNGLGEDQVVLDFENELNQNDDASIIYDNNLYVLDGNNLTSSGYHNGIVSGDNVAYNTNGVSPISFSFSEVVTFESTYMTSSWYTTQDVVFEGYLNGQLIYTSDSIEINYNGPTLIELNWNNIDQLVVYNTPTGIDVEEDNGSGSHWAMDNFTYSLGSGKKVLYETIDVDSQDTNGNEILRDDEVNNLFEGTLTVTDDDDNDTHEFFMASLEEGNYNIGTTEEPMLVNLELGNLANDSTLSIDDIDLDLTINTDGTYSLGGNFTSLAVGETATVTIEYYAVDDSGVGLGNANNEPEKSEHKTITFTITGTNDQPVVDEVIIDVLESELASNPDNQTLTIATDSQYALGNYVRDDDVNDTHSFARAEDSTISLSINTTNATLLTAIANQDLDYIKSVLVEIVSIPEVTTALTNNVDSIPAIDVQNTIAQFLAAPDIATALAIVNSTFSTVGVTAQLDQATGLTLSIDDASVLEEESLLNVTVNQDGSYEVTSPLFDHLSVDDSVSVSFDYVADDGTSDGSGETNLSTSNTVTLNIQGTNDQPVVDEVIIDVLESELASNPDNQTLTIATDSQYALGNYVRDDDVNDTHSFARAEDSTISLSINTTNATLLTAIANQDLDYIKSVLVEIVSIPEVTTALTNNVDSIPAIDVQNTIAQFLAAPDIATALAIVNSTFSTVGVTAQLDQATGLTLSIDDASVLEEESLLNVTVNQDGSYEVTSPLFDHLSVDDSVSVSFDYVADDGTSDGSGETNLSTSNTVTLNIQGTNDQPVVDEVIIDVLESELASNPDNQTLTIATDSQYALGNYVRDDDVNDTHSFARAEDSTISLSINTTNATLLTAIANQDLDYIKSVLVEIVSIPEVTTALTNNVDSIPAIDVQNTIAQFLAAPDIATALAIVNSTFSTVGVTAQLDQATGLTLSIDDASVLEEESLLNVTVNQDGSYEVTSPLFDHLSVDDSVSVSFDYVADDGTSDGNGETNLSTSNTVTLNIQGTNDAPVLSYNSIEDSINENISGKLLGTLDVEDVDSNISSAGFTITGDDSNLVEIRENGGQFELWLKDSAVVDFKTNNSLDIMVTYTDDYSASDSESISIGIIDVELDVVENTQNITLITEENIGTIHGYETTSDSPAGAATDTDDSSITKTYQLDPSLAGQFVSISFDTITYGDGGWEEATATNWADWVTVDDGNSVQQIDADSNASETHTINVKVGAGGVLTLVFDANITGSDSGSRQESVDINNLNINAFVADIALNGVETLSDTNTYSFSHDVGIAYAGETVRVYFDTNTYGSGQWDEASENNTGGYSDYIEVSDGVTSQEIYTADGMNTYYVDAIVDSTGSVNLEFDAKITDVNEHLDIDITSIDVTDKTIDFGSDNLEIDMAQLLSSAEDFNPNGSQTSVDEIDLSSGDHILSNISVNDVLAMTDSDNTLKITGDSGDSIDLDLAVDASNNIKNVNSSDANNLSEIGKWYRDSNLDDGNYEAFVGKDSNGDVVKLLIDQDTTSVI